MHDQNNKLVYDVVDIQKMLGVGRTKAYDFLDKVYTNQKPFVVIKIGKLYKIPKIQFDNWVNGGMKFDI